VPAWAGAAPTGPAHQHAAPHHQAPRRGGRTALAAVAIAVLAGGVGTAGGYLGASLHDSGALSPSNPVTKIFNAAPTVDRSSLAEIAANVQPSVVVVSTGSGEGSGVIMTSDGYVVTNNHVVASAQGQSVTVTYSNGSKAKASVVGTDPRTDVAVVKIENAKNLTAAKFGDSDGVRVGDTVLAIGSPLGLQGSVSAGIVSALHRTISENGQPESPFDNGGTRTTIGDAIQTDAAINPGNSGGALVNTNGEVIGINTAIATNGGAAGNIGVGFAISANKAKSVADQLMKGVKVTHPYLGVNVGEADTGGAEIAKVTVGSPAEKAGLKVGDVVTKIGDQPIANSEDLVAAVQRGTVGESVQITVVRGGQTETITAVLGDAPEN
jgi:putative serine protease PepD